MANNIREYATRTYIRGDETAFVSLFNVENANLAGFVPRTVEYWRWCCLMRSDVDEKGILVVEKEKNVVGYVVVGKSGNIWELCYDSSLNSKTIVVKLLTWAVDYARNIGSDSVVLNAYIEDPVVREICQDLDFAESLPAPVFLSVLDLPRLMQEVLQAKNQDLDTNEMFWFNLKNCPPWCAPGFGVRLEKNRVTVLKEPVLVSSTTIEAEMSTIVALMFGTENVLIDIISLKVRFYPFWKMSKVHKLLSLLQSKTPWFTPRADIG